MKTIEQVKVELTIEEFSLFESLRRLGDSLELAYETVLKERKREDNTEFYRNAYEN